MAGSTLIYWLHELRKEHNNLAGKKSAHLGELSRSGFPVPDGFALSVDAYDAFLFDTGAHDEICAYLNTFSADPDDNRDIPKYEEASRILRRIMESKTVPPDLAGQIVLHYDELCKRTGIREVSVATRSAGPESHPGQYETYLHVRGAAALSQHIVRVWSSTFNVRSLVARARGGFPLDHDAIGVCVLQMVDAKAAGVMFTLNPANGDLSKITIGANWGLGESVVSGSVTPDEWITDKVTFEIVKRTITSKEIEYVLDTDKGQVGSTPVPSDRSNVACLTDDEILELARVGKRIEQHYGVAQDIEWAIARDLDLPKSLFVLQTRPETVWSKRKTESILGVAGPGSQHITDLIVKIKG